MILSTSILLPIYFALVSLVSVTTVFLDDFNGNFF